MEHILETKALSRHYGRIKAVSEVDMHLEKGQIYGFIGKNGSGKTTFMRMIAGMSRPTSGTITLFGVSAPKKKDFSEIGALIEAPGIYPGMTAMDNLHMKCLACGVGNISGYCKNLLQRVGLEQTGKKKAGSFSLGMRQRLGIALALVGEPKLLILDEPTNGLDPQGMAQFRELMTGLKEQGMTVLISSHLLSELVRTADKFGILHEGRLIREFTPEELDAECSPRIVLSTPAPEQAESVLQTLGYHAFHREENGSILISEHTEQISTLNRELVHADVPVEGIYVQRYTVEELYFSLTGGAGT